MLVDVLENVAYLIKVGKLKNAQLLLEALTIELKARKQHNGKSNLGSRTNS